MRCFYMNFGADSCRDAMFILFTLLPFLQMALECSVWIFRRVGVCSSLSSVCCPVSAHAHITRI